MNRLAIIGVGLIGGSLALAAKRQGLVAEVIGVGRNPNRLREAQQQGVLDRYTTDIESVGTGCDLVVFGVPVLAFDGLLQRFTRGWDGTGVLTDVGSTKTSVVKEARQRLAQRFASFVPGHPVAGRERSGFEFADAELFRDHKVILTPEPETDRAAVDLVSRLWRSVGAEVVIMPLARHDPTLAATSHLPHLLAFALVATLAGRDDADEIFEFAAGGFRDFTRVASSDPEMWVDICLANSSALRDCLGEFEQQLRYLEEAIHSGDHAMLRKVFAEAKAARDKRFGSRA